MEATSRQDYRVDAGFDLHQLFFVLNDLMMYSPRLPYDRSQNNYHLIPHISM
ncbi:hypothetical protein PCCS19_05510 [Paenibacillus sp. CCS19]|nr:hypothetical protein PCCS19_05510 [Paenibacillus cellulosilyticus]